MCSCLICEIFQVGCFLMVWRHLEKKTQSWILLRKKIYYLVGHAYSWGINTHSEMLLLENTRSWQVTTSSLEKFQSLSSKMAHLVGSRRRYVNWRFNSRGTLICLWVELPLMICYTHTWHIESNWIYGNKNNTFDCIYV